MYCGTSFWHSETNIRYSFFLRRQMKNVETEASSMFIAYNIKRLINIFSAQELIKRFGQRA